MAGETTPTSQGPGGTDQRPGGSTEQIPEPKPSNGSGETPPNQVSYDSYKKLLDEKKRMQERLDQIAAERKAQETKALEETQQFKTLYEQTQAELKATKDQYVDLDTRIKNSKKIHAVLKNLDGTVDDRYWHLIDTKLIVMDDAGTIDEMSVTKAAENFAKTFPEVIKKPTTAQVPPTPPKGDQGSEITEAKLLEMATDPRVSSKDLLEARRKLRQKA